MITERLRATIRKGPNMHEEAAACIEELAAALMQLAPPKRDGLVDHPVWTTLTKWGLEK